MEIITDPHLSSSIEAASFVKELSRILEAIGACDGEMESRAPIQSFSNWSRLFQRVTCGWMPMFR